MPRTIDEVYESIAQYLLDCVGDNWSELILDVERDADDAIGYTGTFKTLEGVEQYLDVFKLDRRISDDFHELYKIMTEEGEQHKWNRAKFKLSPDGQFSIDFEWDQDLADEIARLSS